MINMTFFFFERWETPHPLDLTELNVKDVMMISPQAVYLILDRYGENDEKYWLPSQILAYLQPDAWWHANMQILQYTMYQ